jgi:ubiquinone/menaquinone biosynthesis C-methylase UbiE
MSLGDIVYGQFERPTGWLGGLVGHLMALKNGRRGRWVLEHLELRPGTRVLEVGSGPGADAARVLPRLGPMGSLVGADASEVMVRQASARNRKAVRDGRALFVHSDIADGLPWDAGEFDLTYSINAAQFWPDLVAGLRELGRVVRRGGRVVVAVQPMRRGATERDSERWAVRFRDAAKDSELTVIDVVRGATTPSTVAAVLEKP